MRSPPRRPLYWTNILFLALTHLLGAAAVVWAALSFSALTLGLAILWLALCMLSTTGGYHRLFAHKTYRGSGPLRLFYLLFGAASFQGPALRWASDHRNHHASTDEADDPHSVRKGFWWAHIGWLLFRSEPSDCANAKDLRADALVRFQDRAYIPLALAFGFLAPTLLGWTWGDATGGLLLAGVLRLLVQYHATFAINSVAHTVGRRPYSEATSARDSFLAAILTLGEGYHNFHHRFPRDYRNGVRALQFDPTKWWIWTVSKLGLARDLYRVPTAEIRRVRALHEGVLK